MIRRWEDSNPIFSVTKLGEPGRHGHAPVKVCQKTKTNPCFMSPRSTSGQARLGFMRQSQSESEQFGALLTVEGNPEGKTKSIGCDQRYT